MLNFILSLHVIESKYNNNTSKLDDIQYSSYS
jgi:hypothetical protein